MTDYPALSPAPALIVYGPETWTWALELAATLH